MGQSVVESGLFFTHTGRYITVSAETHSAKAALQMFFVNDSGLSNHSEASAAETLLSQGRSVSKACPQIGVSRCRNVVRVGFYGSYGDQT